MEQNYVTVTLCIIGLLGNGENWKVATYKLHIKPILNIFVRRLALLLVAGGSVKAEVWIRTRRYINYMYIKMTESVRDSFVKFAELKFTIVDRCSSTRTIFW